MHGVGVRTAAVLLVTVGPLAVTTAPDSPEA